ncbi:MAG: S8 family peptidase [Chitinophagaceae bacterium]|nr:S8 family peptidase [Chitinophagaceae bacterium]
MLFRAVYLLTLLFTLLVTIDASGQGSAAGKTVRLKDRNITLEDNVDRFLEQHGPGKGTTKQVIIRFSSLPSDTERKQLYENGITLLDYISENTFLALTGAQAKTPGKLSDKMIGIQSVKAEWKADNYMWQKASGSKSSIKCVVSFLPGTLRSDVENIITKLGGQLTPGNFEGQNYYNITLPAAALQQLAAHEVVYFIGPATEDRPLDAQSIPAVKGNIAGASPLVGGFGLSGEGVTIGVGDNTSGIFHTDVADRILNYNPAPVTNHGIHINCIAGGAAILDPLAVSMTPKVSLINFFFSSVLSATGSMYKDHNMTITNNSYTVVEGDCGYFGVYDLYSRFLDTMALQYPEVQHVFAAGNDGNMSCPPYAPGYGTVGGGYQPSKNTLVVGSTTHNFRQADNQSRGPVRDGRIRPDIVAVGASVYSGLRNNTYGWAGGTSMAAPQVASGLAVLTERYKQIKSGVQPRADLLKTILLAGAMDLGTSGPDFSYGFGMMDVGRSLSILNENNYFTGDVGQNDSVIFSFVVAPGSKQLRVLLYWNDVPASPYSARQLINDLDLTVTIPDGTVHLPLVPDENFLNILNPATERRDHLNNVEQVTIPTPAPGTYTITIRGYNVPIGPQHFAVAYDLAPDGIQLTYPRGGESISNKDSLRVIWNTPPSAATCSIDFSTDGGTTWSTINPSVAANLHFCAFIPATVNSANCKVRITNLSTGVVVTSGNFVVSTPPIVALNSSQCPGYVNIHWSPVPGATGYEMLRKVGPQMSVVDTVSDTAYSFSAMPVNDYSFVAVQPLINGKRGYRSLAITTIANTGDCSLPVSNGDLMMVDIPNPKGGRIYTSSAPGNSATVVAGIRSLYNTPCSTYIISYRINSLPWQNIADPGIVIPANNTAEVIIPGISFADTGTYKITIAISNSSLPDPEHKNDTFTTTIKCLPNNPIDLSVPFTDDFEEMAVISTNKDSIGISPNAHWDYFNDDDSGRVRSHAAADFIISGNRSISLDQIKPMKHGSNNKLVGTFNLSGYDTATAEIRADFQYILHGTPANPTGNVVTARGNDLQPFKQLYTYDLTAYPGYVRTVRSLSLTDVLRSSASNFSTSTQIAFGQNDTTLIADRNYGTGITIDNFKLYTVSNDAILASIMSPLPGNCGLPDQTPLQILVKNGVNYPLTNITVYYRLDGGPVSSGTITSIRAKDSTFFTFPDLLNIGKSSDHKLDVWLTASGDTYHENDSILNFNFRNSPVITNYPYIENFENSDGGFFTGGQLSSWQYGTPAAASIKKAASGIKAWKTNLTGRHNNLEKSYLYSPCYDISALSNPMLSFSMAQDLENCGNILCDGAYMEYSFDGVQWTKLGDAGSGFNWYDSTFFIWNTIGFTRWHVATTALPMPPVGSTLHLRFVLFADPAVTFEGLAVDDVHIYDGGAPIQPTKDVSTGSEVSSSELKDVMAGDNLLMTIKTNNYTGVIAASLYKQDTLFNPGRTQYTLPRSYKIEGDTKEESPAKLRLFLLDSDVAKVAEDTVCSTCTPVTDAYSLGVTCYSNSDKRAINGSLLDDTGGKKLFIPASSIQWIPYLNGYRAEFAAPTFSEYWFNNGGPGGNVPATADYLSLTAFAVNEGASVLWRSLINEYADHYYLERSDSGTSFATVFDVAASGGSVANYNYVDTTSFAILPIRYYRIRTTMKNGTMPFYSPVRRITQGDAAETLLHLDAAMLSAGSALITWTSGLDGITKEYSLKRAIDNGPFKTIYQQSANGSNDFRYSFNDHISGITSGTQVHYQVTSELFTEHVLLSQTRTVAWINGSAVTGIFPNPTNNGSFSVVWNADINEKMDLEVTDITGRSIYRSTTPSIGWHNVTKINTSISTSGIYIIRMSIAGERHTARLVID